MVEIKQAKLLPIANSEGPCPSRSERPTKSIAPRPISYYNPVHTRKRQTNEGMLSVAMGDLATLLTFVGVSPILMLGFLPPKFGK